MKLHREGLKIIPVAFFFLAVLDFAIYLLLRNTLIFYVLMAASLILAGLIVFFFRVPKRKIFTNDKHVLSPADGEIVEILTVNEKEYFRDERIQISIFMSPLNVHQNRAPVSGEVVYHRHHPGRFYPAFVAKSSERNERCSIVFRMKNGTEVLSRQIAGMIARRIATYKVTGDFCRQGDEYGFIRFGSRVDVFLPPGTTVHVKLHQKATGGKTVLASLAEK